MIRNFFRANTFKCLTILLVLLASASNNAFSQTINFRNYTVFDGLANSNLYYTLQDSRGFLWIATSSGVNRFDGKNFELFTTDNGLADNEVLMIYEDSKGRIWFLNFNGRLGYYFDGKFYNPDNNKTLKKAITKASYISCYEDSSNRLWFTTNQQQIIEIDKVNVRIYKKPRKDIDISNSFIFEDSQNRILAANSKGFYYLKDGTISPAPSDHLPVTFKSHRFNKQTKELQFLSTKGLIELKGGRFQIIRTIPEEIIRNGMSSFLVNKSDLWISSVNKGVFKLNGDGKTVDHYLEDKIISALMRDRDGNIWVTSLGDGLIILPVHTENILQYTTTSGLPENTIYSVSNDNKGRTWLGLKSGKICVIDGKKISSINLLNTNTPYNPIVKMVFSEKETVWFITNSSLGKFYTNDPKRKVTYLREKRNLTFIPKSISISKQGKLAFSLASGVYIMEDKEKPLVFETEANLPGQRFFKDRSFKLLFDSKERLWFSNVNGLFRYSQNKVDTLSKRSELFAKRVTDMMEMPDGSMVIGTYGYGLIVLDTQNRITRIGLKEGLSSNICRKLAFDGKYIWLTTFKGVDKFEYNSDKRIITTYKVKNGLTSDEVMDIFISDKKILLATKAGLTVLPRNDAPSKFSPPLFYITRFAANGKNYNTGKIPQLKYHQNNISVNYTAINFSLSNEIYQYRLKDDVPWTETTNSSIEFGSLEPGKYELSVRARLQESEWSQTSVARFEIIPAIWQRWWFLAMGYLIVSVLIIGMIYLYFKKQREKEQDKITIQTKVIALEQRALQAMMNPHFVFNIMNSIQYFINTKDSQAANQVLTGFARLIRKNLEICTKSYITLEEELIYLKLYLSLEKLRFGDKMTYDIVVDKDLDTEEILIPTMLLQPFVENAIWHGIMPQKNGGIINIRIYYENNEITVFIIDNGTGIENSQREKTSSHVSRGMQITRDRINLLNKNKKGQISIETAQTGSYGTKVTVKIPA